LNSVACGVAGEEGAGEPSEWDGTAEVLGAELADVGAVVAVGEDEPHPANKVSASAPVARPAVGVEGMPPR
jgi:hypothetical protein